MMMGRYHYKLFGMVTNMKWDGEEVIHWQRERCGKSEEAHSVMKEDLAGGKLPSGKFGVNAAWWWIMVLALNLNQVMKQLVLGHNWTAKCLKAIRFALINLPARVMSAYFFITFSVILPPNYLISIFNHTTYSPQSYLNRLTPFLECLRRL